MDHSTIEKDLGCIRNQIKISQALFEFLIVVGIEGLHPGLDFLEMISMASAQSVFDVRTCLSDMTSYEARSSLAASIGLPRGSQSEHNCHQLAAERFAFNCIPLIGLTEHRDPSAVSQLLTAGDGLL